MSSRPERMGEPLVRLTHIVVNESPSKALNELDEFVSELKDIEYTTHISTTPIVTGVQGGNANLVVMTSILIVWYDYKSKAEAYIRRMELLNKWRG